jgi:dienelactone hydrolase
MMKKKYASILLALIIAGSCLAEEITLNGADGFALVADYYAGSDGGAGVILMHQCNGERSMYQELGALLAGQGVHVLAMDFRGYGDSVTDGVNIEDIRASTADFNEYRKVSAPIREHWVADVNIAADYLKERIGEGAVIGAGGASCGGFQAVVLAEQRNVGAIMTFSSGLSEEMLERYKALGPVPTLIIAAEEDGSTYERALALFAESGDPGTRMISYKGEGHGSPLFEQDPTLASTIAGWYALQLASTD